MHTISSEAARGGQIGFGREVTVSRLGFGAMRLTGAGIKGEPRDPEEARRVLRRAVELGVDLIDTAHAYGPEVSERLIAEALHPYPDGLIVATKSGLQRDGIGGWYADGRPETIRGDCERSLTRRRRLAPAHAAGIRTPRTLMLAFLRTAPSVARSAARKGPEGDAPASLPNPSQQGEGQ
jgi:Aldo/keto reductase family